MVEKRYAAITRSDFAKLKEDLRFLDNALKTVLSEYKDYFQERFVERLLTKLAPRFSVKSMSKGCDFPNT